MTALKVVEIFDKERKNDIPLELKQQWISELDMKITSELLIDRDCNSETPFCADDDINSALNAPNEYSEIYVLYLKMKSDYILGEIQRYNNSSAIFNRLYYEMANYISRNFKSQKQHKIKVGFNV